MADAGQNQGLDGADLNQSSLQQTQAGRDAVTLQNSPDAQVIIHRSFIALFGDRATPSDIDWQRARQILQREMQPEIKKRLKDSLFGLAEVDLAEEPESVARVRSPFLALEAVKTLTTDEAPQELIDPQAPIIQTYAREDIQGKLLILGTPGAGKTTTLLKLAEQLVDQAIAQPQTVIPIMFELSTWREGQDIQAWLIEQLYENYGGNRRSKVYERWLEQRVLLPLLDGLDELGMVRQQACTQQINAFAKHYPQVVVCCRVKEFRQAGVKLSNLRGAVQLQPLTDRQIQEYLTQVGKLGLWQQMQTVPEMGRLLEPVVDPEDPEDEGEPGLLRVPLFIALAAKSYTTDSAFRDKSELLDCYITHQLSRDFREYERFRRENTNRAWAYKSIDDEPNNYQT
jgi:predicted NACHT family NTPase